MCTKNSVIDLTAHVYIASQESLSFKNWNGIWGCF